MPSRWTRRFRDAFRGLALGLREERSFVEHLVCAALVVAAASWLQVAWLQWGLLMLCIFAVLAAEMFNSALERMARAITAEQRAEIGAALDLAAAAVLLTALGAASVGGLILVPPLIQRAQAWLAAAGG